MKLTREYVVIGLRAENGGVEVTTIQTINKTESNFRFPLEEAKQLGVGTALKITFEKVD